MLKSNKVVIFFDFYLQFLIFSIINRSFVPFNIDLRYIVVFLAFIAILVSLFSNQEFKINKNIVLILVLYFFIIIGFFNQKTINVDKQVYLNLIILNLYCFFNILVLSYFSSYIKINNVWKYITYAWYFLFFSVIVSAIGWDLPFNDYKGSYISSAEVGSGIRFSGYGTDPNYVCIIAIILIILTHTLKKSKKVKIPIYIMATLVIILTRSRTALVIALILFCMSIVDKFMTTEIKILVIDIIFICLALVPILMLVIKPFNNNISMALRYDLWEQAFHAFLKHPILGNGLMAGRNLAFYNLNWFVQSHSTYFQLLCDNGIIALFLYFLIFFTNVIKNINNPLKYIFLIYFAWSFSYETMYLTYTILFLGIFPYCTVNFKGDSKQYE